MKQLLFEKKTSIFMIPWVVSIILTYMLFSGVLRTSPRYGTRSCILAAMILLGWTIAVIIDQRRLMNDELAEVFIRCRPIILLFLAFFIGVFLSFTVWGVGYLSLFPYEKIDNGTQQIDDLFHSAIAESCSRSLFPSTLLNDERYLSYHTFSHMIMGIIAHVMGMPSFIAYNYIYPILFLPIYCFSILSAILSAKLYFEGNSVIKYFDIVIISIFINGCLTDLSTFGIYKISYIISESFLTANTVAFLSYSLTFYILRKHISSKRILGIYLIVAVPIEIFIISWSKISVGFVFTFGIMFFIFRYNVARPKYWGLDVLYFLSFYFSKIQFNANGTDDGILKYKWLAYGDYCSGRTGIWGHILILSIMILMIVFFDFIRNRYRRNDFISGKTIWVETIIVMGLCAFFPGMLIAIDGGAAMYFSFAIEVPAIVLLCGHDYVDIDKESWGNTRILFYAICFCWCMWTGLANNASNPLELISNEHTTNLSSVLLEIRKSVGDSPEEYTIYLDDDNIISQVFEDSKTSIFVCPAMTGVGVINATYVDEGEYYTYKGDISKRYGTHMVDNGYLDLDQALSLAKERGKKKLIHLTDKGYEVIDL